MSCHKAFTAQWTEGLWMERRTQTERRSRAGRERSLLSGLRRSHRCRRIAFCYGGTCHRWKLKHKREFLNFCCWKLTALTVDAWSGDLDLYYYRVEKEETSVTADQKPAVSKSGRKIKGRGTMVRLEHFLFQVTISWPVSFWLILWNRVRR